MRLDSMRTNVEKPARRTWRALGVLAGLALWAEVAVAAPYTVRHDFAGPDGAAPYSALTLAADGFLYGTTQFGGASDAGTVFRIDGAGTLTTLYEFGSAVGDAARPTGALLEASDGRFYGTAYLGGDNDLGALYVLDVSGAPSVTTLYSFGSQPDDGNTPNGGLVEDPDALLTFYGTTFAGGANDLGTVFQLALPSGDVTILHSFGGTDGSEPWAALLRASDGNYYGTTGSGGEFAIPAGTIFRLSFPGGVPTVDSIHSFDIGTDGGKPHSTLIEVAGSLYGTTTQGGNDDLGTVFSSDLDGNTVLLHSFAGADDGADPEAALLRAANGDFYGTTALGGEDGFGSVFRVHLEPGGGATVTRVHSFDGVQGANPMAALVQGSDDAFYGVTFRGTPDDLGVVFRLVDCVPPTADASGSAEICSGGSTALSGSGGVSCSWSPATGLSDASSCTPTASPSSTTTYTLTVTDAEGCTSENAPTVTVMVNEAPTAAASGSATICAGGSTPLSGSGGVSCSWSPAIGLSDASSCAPTASPSTTTTYTLTVTDAEGCISQNAPTVTVTVNQAPTAAASGSATICAGGSTPLSGSGGVSCSWSPATGLSDAFSCTPTASPSSTTTYTLTVLDAIGCASVNAPTVTVTVSPLPTATVSGSTTICAGFATDIQAALSGVGPWTLLWSDGVTQSGVAVSPATRSVSPAATTTYTVMSVTDASACSNSGSGSAVVTVGDPVPAPAITAPLSAVIGATGLTASVDDHVGSTYAWTLAGGTITSGQGSSQVTFDAGSPGTTMVLSVVETNTACSSPAGTARVQVDFLDVPPPHIFHDFVNTIARNGVTAGCGSGNYCPDGPNTRAQMAVFLLKSSLGPDYVPPMATGTVFADVPVGSFAADWIEDLASRGITGGCGGGNYCPNASVTRAQMAVFLLKTLLGSSYAPPQAVGIFADVPVGSFAADWIEDLYNRSITGGCQANPLSYCPNSLVTRGQMAVFLTKTFELP